MRIESLQQRYREYLDTLPLSVLRILGRQEGVGQVSSDNKGDLVEAIVSVLTGEKKPAPRSNRGARPKLTFLDPAVRARIEEIRRQGEAAQRVVLEVGSGATHLPPDAAVTTGILEIEEGGYGFLREMGLRVSSENDVFVPAPLIRSLGLREGDLIACALGSLGKDEQLSGAELLSVNGQAAGPYHGRPQFSLLHAAYPDEQICLAADGDLSLRVIDLFAPVGKGQRVLLYAPPATGRTTLLRTIAAALPAEEVVPVVLLLDERPEDVTEFMHGVKNAHIVYTSIDECAEAHVRAARLVAERAKRLAELGRDVVILLDSLTKLERACAASGKTSDPVRQFFGMARKCTEGGSVAVIAAADESGGYLQMSNACIALSPVWAERGVFPAFDLARCGTRRAERMLAPQALAAASALRREELPALLQRMKESGDNAALIASIKG